MRIWKYTIAFKFSSEENYLIPEGGKFLHVEHVLATGEVAMWFLVNPDVAKEGRKFKFFATGVEVPNKGYLGTFVTGMFIWHLFEI